MDVEKIHQEADVVTVAERVVVSFGPGNSEQAWQFAQELKRDHVAVAVDGVTL